MISLFKSVLPGVMLSWLVSTFVGAHGGTGGLLNIRHFQISGTDFAMSWTLMVIGTSLAWAIFRMME